VEQLDPVEKLVYLYCITGPLSNMEGLYKCSVKRMAFETGLDQDTTGRILDRLESMGLAGARDGWVCVTQATQHMPLHNPQMMKHAERVYEKVPESTLKWVRDIGYRFADDTYMTHRTRLDKTRQDSKETHPTLKVPINKKRYEKLCSEWSRAKVDDYIQRAVDYSASSGKKYKDYAATAANWLRRDNPQGPPRRDDDGELSIDARRKEVFGE